MTMTKNRVPKPAKVSKAKVVAKDSSKPVARAEKTLRNYPFPTKREIVDRIMASDAEAIAALVLVNSLDAAMCSQKALIRTLAARVNEGARDAATVGECRTFARRYGRRLAVEARRQVLEKNPELADLATLFTAKV